jgi:hypothetical protein
LSLFERVNFVAYHFFDQITQRFAAITTVIVPAGRQWDREIGE